MSEYRDYENGVADVLAFLAGDSATVERNVRLPGRRSGRSRQIDVLVRGRIFGMTDATLIVDCKRRRAPVDVKAVESFIGMIEDVGADVGIVMTTAGSTGTARDRVGAERGVRLEVMTLRELMAWSPPGTVTATYRVPADRRADVEKALRMAGFRVAPTTGFEAASGEVILDTIRHYGTRTPSAEIQQRHMTEAVAALRSIAVEPAASHMGLRWPAAPPHIAGSPSQSAAFQPKSKCLLRRRRKPSWNSTGSLRRSQRWAYHATRCLSSRRTTGRPLRYSDCEGRGRGLEVSTAFP